MTDELANAASLQPAGLRHRVQPRSAVAAVLQ